MKKQKTTSISPVYITFAEESISGKIDFEHRIIFPGYDDYINSTSFICWENRYLNTIPPRNFRVDLYKKL